jgi:hypothetical protein
MDGCCKYGGEPPVSGATKLVSKTKQNLERLLELCSWFQCYT